MEHTTNHRSLEDIIVSLSFPSDPQLSPDGCWVAYVAAPYGKDGDHFGGGIWLAPTDGSAMARRFTFGPGRDEHPRWSPDSQTLAFLSDREERGTKALYLISVEGGEARQLLKRKTSIETFAWSPDGRHIAFTSTDESTEEDERRKDERDDADVYGEDWKFTRLHVLEISSGEVRTLPAGERHVIDFAWSPDSTQLAFLAMPTPEIDSRHKSEIFIVRLDDDQTREVCRTGSWFVGQLDWTADGRALIFFRSHEETLSGFAVFTVDPSGGEPRLVAPGEDEQACGIGVRAARNESRALMTVAQGLTTRLEWVDIDSGHRETFYEPPPGDDIAEEFSVVVPAGGEPVLAVLYSIEGGPTEVHTGTTGPLHRVSDHHASLSEFSLGVTESFYWSAPDGLELDGVIIRPSNSGDQPLPTVVQIHGGPYGRYTMGWDLQSQWLAAHGFAVFMPNYRGGEGHGNAFAKWAQSGVGDKEFLDIMSGVDAIVDRGISDPERLGIGGWSQGGFLTAWAVTQTNRFKAGVMGAGISDWNMMVMTSDIPTVEAMMGGGKPWDGPDSNRARRHSPISYAKKVQTPLLIVHGKEDARVPVSQAIGFERALRENGATVQLVTYPREPHGIRERNHQRDMLRRVRDWFQKWV